MSLRIWLVLPTHSPQKRLIIKTRMLPYRLALFKIEIWTGSSTGGLYLGQVRMLRQMHEAKNYKNIRLSSKDCNQFRDRSKSKN